MRTALVLRDGLSYPPLTLVHPVLRWEPGLEFFSPPLPMRSPALVAASQSQTAGAQAPFLRFLLFEELFSPLFFGLACHLPFPRLKVVFFSLFPFAPHPVLPPILLLDPSFFFQKPADHAVIPSENIVGARDFLLSQITRPAQSFPPP